MAGPTKQGRGLIPFDGFTEMANWVLANATKGTRLVSCVQQNRAIGRYGVTFMRQRGRRWMPFRDYQGIELEAPEGKVRSDRTVYGIGKQRLADIPPAGVEAAVDEWLRQLDLAGIGRGEEIAAIQDANEEIAKAILDAAWGGELSGRDPETFMVFPGRVYPLVPTPEDFTEADAILREHAATKKKKPYRVK